MTRAFSIAWGICLAWIAVLAADARAADPDIGEAARAMDVWRTADGLPSDSVTAIIQTRDGFIWIGTDRGLARFDGIKFNPVALAPSATNAAFHVTALCEDSNGNVWIGTQDQGLFEVVATTIRHFTTGLLDDDVTSVAAGPGGEVWIGTKSGLDLWSGKKFEGFTVRDGLPDEMVTGVNVARSGTVWITTRVGMCRFIKGRIVPYAFQTQSQGRRPEYLGAYEDRYGNLWAFGDTYLINLAENKRFNYFRNSESASVRIWSLCEGHDGRLWIGTSGRGLFCFEHNHFEPVLFGGERWPYDVRDIFEDKEGDLWLGTSGGGLIQLRPQPAYIPQEQEGLPDVPVTALAAGPGGQVYLSLERGGLYAGQSGQFDPVENAGSLGVQNYVSSIEVARDGTVWAGTLGAGIYGLGNGREVHLTTADGLADNNVTVVCCANDGVVWFATRNRGLYRWTGEDLAHFELTGQTPLPAVTAMAPSASGGLWLGTKGGRLLREKAGRLSPVRGLSAQSPVLALCEGDAGELWIGTADGLNCLVNGRVFHWDTRNGLPSDVVAGIVEGPRKNLWLATGAGIFRISRGQIEKLISNGNMPMACQLVSPARTIPDFSMICGGRRAVISSDGLLWFATSDGVLKVDTRDPQMVPSAFPVYIESVAFNGHSPVSLLQGGSGFEPSSRDVPFQAPADLHSVEFQFTALAFAMPKDVEFRHKLEGNDSDWVDDAGARVARYGRLPYGHYVFRVQARSPQGAWQEAGNTLAFIVPAPIYFQNWALCLYVLMAMALLTGAVRMASHRRLRLRLARLEQQQTLERERMRIARDMHDEMGSKLTKISFLSECASTDAKSGKSLSEKIDSIAQTSRELLKTMDEIVWAVNPRNDNLENLANYLAHHAIEYFQNTAVECDLRLPRETPHYPLSSETRHNLFLAFEEALNNVLKHSTATRVKVEMNALARKFELKIMDNGKGFETPAAAPGGRGGNGLRNMRQRMVAIGGECGIWSRVHEGTVITLWIPLEPKISANP